MEVTIKFDLDKEEDRKLYQTWNKMKEITLNLEKLHELMINYDSGYAASFTDRQVIDMHDENSSKLMTYFNEMIWKKLS